MQTDTKKEPAGYSRATLGTLLDPHRHSLVWFEEPNFSAKSLEAEYCKAAANIAVLDLQIGRLPDDDPRLAGLFSAVKAEKDVARSFVKLLQLAGRL